MPRIASRLILSALSLDPMIVTPFMISSVEPVIGAANPKASNIAEPLKPSPDAAEMITGIISAASHNIKNRTSHSHRRNKGRASNTVRIAAIKASAGAAGSHKAAAISNGFHGALVGSRK